jgi:hypothetical protein
MKENKGTLMICNKTKDVNLGMEKYLMTKFRVPFFLGLEESKNAHG